MLFEPCILPTFNILKITLTSIKIIERTRVVNLQVVKLSRVRCLVRRNWFPEDDKSIERIDVDEWGNF